MEFIIQNSGFLFGVLLIAILAIIGYYADKNESKNKSDIKSDNSVNSFNDSSNTNISEIPDISVQNNISNSDLDSNDSDSVIQYASDDKEKINSEDVLSSNDDLNSLENGVSDNDVSDLSDPLYGMSSFENLDISLADLEKKNYDNIVSNNLNSDDSDNYYYSVSEKSSKDLEVPFDSISNENESMNNIDSFVSSQNDLTKENFDDEIIISGLNKTVDAVSGNDSGTALIDNGSINHADVSDLSGSDSSKELVYEDTDSDNHEFDSEIDESSSKSDLTIADEANFAVPELYDFQEQNVAPDLDKNSSQDNAFSSVDLSNNLTEDDMWKF